MQPGSSAAWLCIHFILKSFKAAPRASSAAMKQSHPKILMPLLCLGIKRISPSSLSQFGFPAAFPVLGDVQLQHLRQQPQSVPRATLGGQTHLVLPQEGISSLSLKSSAGRGRATAEHNFDPFPRLLRILSSSQMLGVRCVY